MTKMNKGGKMIKKLGIGLILTGGGVYFGIRFEAFRHRNDKRRDFYHNGGQIVDMPRKYPALPMFGTVSAATPLAPPASGSEYQLAPHVSEPEVQIPGKKESSIGYPKEPPQGLNRISEIMRFGFPGLDNIRSHRDYVISYDRKNRVAHWVFEHLTKTSVARNEEVDRAKCDFREDKSIHPFFRSTNADYKYSGFDRGHLAAAGNHRQSQEICNETFLLSNMAPQVGSGFNRDKWEHLERYVRSLTKVYKNVYVCTGPLYLPKKDASDGKLYVKYEVIGPTNVSVPTHFFKVVVAELDNDRGLEMEAYVLPNEKIPDSVPLATFQVQFIC